MIKDLPCNYWDFIMEFLPDYTRRDDVLLSDIYNRYLDGEEVSEEDYQHYFANKSRETIEDEFNDNEWGLLLEAFDNFSAARYDATDTAKPQSNCIFEQLGNKKYLPNADGVFYVAYPNVYEINEFLGSLSPESFVFEVTGPMDDERMRHFNSLIQETQRKCEICCDVATASRMNYLHEIGCDLQFFDTATPIARANLIKCGGMEMPAIVAGMLKEFYFNNLTSLTTMDDCIEYLAEKDIAGYGFDDLKTTYRVKIAHLLQCIFTGMRLDSNWNGRQEVNGGYIVVKKDGDVVAFFSTIPDEFKDFLVANMVMEWSSHSSHNDLVIYKEDDRYYLRLALQLRFILSR